MNIRTVAIISSLVLSACGADTGVPGAPATAAAVPAKLHNYVMRDKSQYGYEANVSADAARAGQVANQVVMIRYAGEKDGRYQAFAQEGPIYTVMECEKPCEFAKLMSFAGGEHVKTERLRAVDGSMVRAVMDDVMSGQLDQAKVTFTNGGGPYTVWFDEQNGILKSRVAPSGS